MAKKRSPSRALRVGKQLAAQSLQRRAKARRARARALAAHPAPVTRSISAAGPSAVSPAAPVRSASAGTLIAEGDSWFDYPFHDVLSDLEDSYGYDVESVAHWGDTVEAMAYSGGQLDEFSRRVEKVLRSGVVPKAILLSGGGNDLAAEDFAILLNHARSPHAGLNDEVVAGLIDQRLYDSYVAILQAISEICRAHMDDDVPILVHGYDYAVPDGRGFMGGWGPLPGPWLEPGFRQKGYPNPPRAPMVKTLIDRFNVMLSGLPRIPGLEHVVYLDLRGTLPTGRSYKDWWANELHPTAKGFAAVTRKFAERIG